MSTQSLLKGKIMTDNKNKGRFEENNRVSRSAETRDSNISRKPWAPPSMLETPQPLMDMSIDGSELKF